MMKITVGSAIADIYVYVAVAVAVAGRRVRRTRDVQGFARLCRCPGLDLSFQARDIQFNPWRWVTILLSRI